MKKNWKRKMFITTGILTCGYTILNIIAKKKETFFEKVDEETKEKKQKKSIYETKIKRMMDKSLAFLGLIFFAPICGMIALAIYIDDPGPILFSQKRVGKDKQFFRLYKFRSMKMDTPHDVPTHQLVDPKRHITRVGRFLRKYSLDELPQIWNIFAGDMSIIGPRPALWNQADLIAERDMYDANSVLPGLTGWAQISGRDELEIADKAKLDGQYVDKLRQGGIEALFFDVKCFLGTICSVVGSDGVVEGGTGELYRKATENAGFKDYGYLKHFDIDISEANKKKVLITGADSYIGQAFECWAKEHYPANFMIDTVDMLDQSWKKKDFSLYDVIFHVAGIAHADVGDVDEATKKKYYAVNRDLAIETAEKARIEGVKQFVFMSSMIIYGESAPYGKKKIIDEYTVPNPSNFYGDSKWQADKGIRALGGGDFHVAVLRPPMIYGKGSKGNYQILVKLAKKLPIFPDVDNQRSMLYIDNLSEFLCKLMLSGESGVYFPQNGEYTKTSEMAKKIAEAAGKKIWITKLLNLAVMLGRYFPGKISELLKKGFGNNIYSQKLSEYEGLEYRNTDLDESVRRIERKDSNKKPHILVVSQYFYPETFRINDMSAEWAKRGYKVTVLTGIPNYPKGRFFDGYDYTNKRTEQWKGLEIIRMPLIPRGNSSIGIVANYISFTISGWWWTITTNIHADLVFTFEVSPMTQALIGCWYSKKYRVPHFLYVQDLWPENVEMVTGIKNRTIIYPINRMVDYIYKNTNQIFTTSQSFVDTIINRDVKVDKDKVHYWPQYAEEFYKPFDRKTVRNKSDITLPVDLISDKDFNIVFTGNIGKAQGLDILPKAAEKVKKFHMEISVKFIIIGDGRYQEILEAEIKRRKVADSFIIIPRQSPEVIPLLLACCDAAFLSFSDTALWKKTIPAKLQSYMACGMPIIAAAQGETEQVIKEADCGICCKIGDAEELAVKIHELAELSSTELERLGNNSRAYCMCHYNKAALMNEMDNYFELGMNPDSKSISFDRVVEG